MPKITHKMLLDLVPKAPDWSVDWPSIWALWPADMAALDVCPQDPIHHAEGDVGLHTRMVCEALVAQSDWRAMDFHAQSLLFWSCVLHDIGKPLTTKAEPDGRISARGHARVGAHMARAKLWAAGSPFDWREALCGLISEHLLPFWLIEREQAKRLAIQTSWRCRPDWLCLHGRADALGRICDDQAYVLDNITLAEQQFAELDCFDKPFEFASDASRVVFFEKPDRDPYYAEHADFGSHVMMMSGLPGSGKDTWIANHHPELPVISLDAIREQLGARPTGNQGAVIQAAREQARIYLRAGQDFIWNATGLTRQLREKSLTLFRDYKARTEIIYLEVPSDKLFAQNRNRDAVVPEAVISKMVDKFEPPQAWEAHSVRFLTP